MADAGTDKQNRQGRIERIVEAYAAERGLSTVKDMLLRWQKEGLDTYEVADLLGATHQGVSYLHRKHGIALAGNRATAKMERAARRRQFPSLAAYFDAAMKKTIREQAEDLGVSDMTIKRYRKAHRESEKKRGAGTRDAGRVEGTRGKRRKKRGSP